MLNPYDKEKYPVSHWIYENLIWQWAFGRTDYIGGPERSPSSNGNGGAGGGMLLFLLLPFIEALMLAIGTFMLVSADRGLYPFGGLRWPAYLGIPASICAAILWWLLFSIRTFGSFLNVVVSPFWYFAGREMLGEAFGVFLFFLSLITHYLLLSTKYDKSSKPDRVIALAGAALFITSLALTRWTLPGPNDSVVISERVTRIAIDDSGQVFINGNERPLSYIRTTVRTCCTLRGSELWIYSPNTARNTEAGRQLYSALGEYRQTFKTSLQFDFRDVAYRHAADNWTIFDAVKVFLRRT